jgi:cell division protein FtsB
MRRPTRLRAAVIAAVAVVAVVMGAWGVNGALRARTLQQEIDATEREIGALKAQASRLAETIDRLRNDPAYIEKLAREEHGLVREDETVLKFPPKQR